MPPCVGLDKEMVLRAGGARDRLDVAKGREYRRDVVDQIVDRRHQSFPCPEILHHVEASREGSSYRDSLGWRLPKATLLRSSTPGKRVLAASAFEELRDRDLGEPEGGVELAVREQTAVGGDSGTVELELDPAVEIDPQRLRCCFTYRLCHDRIPPLAPTR
jgi:hypothetical protein